jgi:LmbE family N-acetylglucosaminyl deacetylase
MGGRNHPQLSPGCGDNLWAGWGYGHPDHSAISTATTAACQRSAQSDKFPAQLAAGLPVHQPVRVYRSYFPSKRQLLLEQLGQ